MLIKDIIVGEHRREDLGDVIALAKSIQESIEVRQPGDLSTQELRLLELPDPRLPHLRQAIKELATVTNLSKDYLKDSFMTEIGHLILLEDKIYEASARRGVSWRQGNPQPEDLTTKTAWSRRLAEEAVYLLKREVCDPPCDIAMSR